MMHQAQTAVFMGRDAVYAGEYPDRECEKTAMEVL